MSQIRNASDTTCKQFLRDVECFADLCNALYFHGRQVIKPENLISQENDVSTLIGKEALPMKTKRYRDIVRKASINGEYMIIGVEHQSTLNKNMIIRILNYDAQLYINQVESGKEVRPVGSFVFYTGDKEWTYPKSLKESLKVSPEMEDYINDWKLPVLELQKMDPQILKSKRLKEVVEISQSMLEGDYEKLRTNRMISVENYKIAAILTHTDIKEEDLPEGDEINMCKAMDQLFQRFENQGIEKGEAIGIEKTLKEQLKVKRGTISSPLEEKLTTTSLEKLNELTLNIFNINSEEDVLKIIH
ncbi:MAG: Rpn family recombination-promoting nuclease/putative transposase [Faecalibacillus intestinalis]